ncbi:S-locus lectin protein kinase family protein [Perilla frutescens var. hirtella]|uniref:non-specific serine/threonine protein kinase n=1 Tax=Perilla frutescens var. hirtella TaxID=608512 RepID=A0AAD4IT75_PERFH|nr:S-locus lectin protein kinase family protein [Perilla frutescens var. hirtella]
MALVVLRLCRAQGMSRPSSNPCETSGKCGAYGVCSPGGSPICSCLRGFDPLNNLEWSSENWTQGCVRRVPLSCDEGNNDGFVKLQAMMMSVTDRWYGPESMCEAQCLSNCSCLAYSFAESSRGCRFWGGPLVDIQIFPSDSGSYLYIRRKKDIKKVIIILVVVAFVIISICYFFSRKWIAKLRGKKKSIELANVSASLEDALRQVKLQELPLFTFETLAIATNNFSQANRLGKGGFGPVYKGQLANGREIAVKMLYSASGQGMQEFMNEVMLISKLQHKNLVKLLGSCVDVKERMLIYEYMPNKSLDFFLFDSSQEILDWRKRFKIIENICRGLLYLHRDSRLKIIHRDIKPSNILLDNDWNPKISDFGMARIFGTKQDHARTVRVVGTYGYMAPEYAIEGRFSEKTDVFSLGVVILEIATGRKNSSFYHQEGSLNLLGHVWNLWKEGKVASLIDKRVSSSNCQAEVMRCMHIGLLCVQELAKERPSTSAVLSMLISEIIELPYPKKPAFAIKSTHFEAGTSTYSHPSRKSSSSINDVTLTMVDAR